EGRATQECDEALISLAKEQGFPYQMAFGAILHGWVLAQQGQAQEGIEQIIQGLTAWRATGSELLRPYFLALLAEAHGTIGEPATWLGSGKARGSVRKRGSCLVTCTGGSPRALIR